MQFVIYRQSGSTLSYDKLPLSIIVFAQRNLDFVNCLSIPLNSTEQFEIQPNDIIGVCMRDQLSIHTLYVSMDASNNTIRVSSIDQLIKFA